MVNEDAKKEKNPNDVSVNGVKDGNDKRVVIIGQGDPVALLKDGKTYTGVVKEVDKDQVTMMVKDSQKTEIKVATKDLEPLFFENSDAKKIWTKFSYAEVSRAMNNTPDFKAKLEANQILPLMLGNRSAVMSFEKKINDDMVKVDGKIELRRGVDGNPQFFHIVKNKELNLDRPVYGVQLNQEQKDKLTKTGELGLVNGFKAGDKEYSLWVSLDKDLNSVVTKRENDIYLNKIYGVTLNEEQKNKIKSGEGALVEIKKGENVFVLASAASSKQDGLKIYSEEKAREFKLLKQEAPDGEKKKSSKGIKI